ncbi:MAG: hypothetical protein U0M12_04725 [Acutalibacteraceae bacterium]|jgi:hypothetical protein|nr:hypothetical protein [Acutalibacteraceae bacterium]
MSLKNRDEHNRWRNKTVAFRVSPEEDKQIEAYVRLSGLTKQDYITRRLTHRDIVVQGNPRVFKALRNQLSDVLSELQRIEAGGEVNDELLDVIEMIADILGGLKGEDNNGE